jgi:short-subunit dehydrogenase
MANDTSARTVLITGTSTGIGFETALELDRRGYRVFAGVRRESDMAALSTKASKTLTPVMLDVTKPEAIASTVASVATATADRGLYALVNNAGFNYNSAVEFSDPNKSRALMETNFFGLANLTQACLPLLRQSGVRSGTTAKLVNVGSIGSLVGVPWEAYYHASKFAVLGWSESLHSEVYTQGIRVCVVCPGGIKTPFISKTGAGIAEAIASMPSEGERLYGRGLRTLTRLSGQVDRLGSNPNAVARAISRLLDQKNPRFETLVGLDARMMRASRRFLPRSWFHTMLRSTFGC